MPRQDALAEIVIILPAIQMLNAARTNLQDHSNATEIMSIKII